MILIAKWKSITSPPSDTCAAIYKIRLKGVKQINRFLGEDKECILSIGETNNIRKRINQFRISMEKGPSGKHSEGRTLFGIIKSKNRNITADYIEYCYIPKSNETEAKEAEKEEIWRYLEKFGEVPPLNGNIPKREQWLTKL